MKVHSVGGSEGQKLLSVSLKSSLPGQASAVNVSTFEPTLISCGKLHRLVVQARVRPGARAGFVSQFSD